jgi:hypothetical protein
MSTDRQVGALSAKTKFVAIRSISYYNNEIDHLVLVPFTYSNGVLDVKTLPGFYPADGEGNNYGGNWRMVKPMGGNGLVNTLGASFIEWFTSYEGTVDSDSVSIYVAPVMTKVQQTSPANSSILNPASCLVDGLTEAPSGDEFVTGLQDPASYDTAWVFKTPLVIKYTFSGTVYYASLYTHFDY